MKRILVIGAAGMIGRKLVARLQKDGAGELIQQDVVPFEGGIVSDLSSPGEAEKLITKRPDLIFHLAAVVSGEAEADFEKGYRVNLDGTRYLFEAIRKANYKPKVVFTSSIAVFGAPFPDAIGDEFLNAPLTSYGTQKAISELLLSDYSRRGFFDGVGIRLPTICVRPGKPNKAASGFFSGIL
ncbi:MAG TPA: NAD-dependent epimerase/dehydratase family protein, partial [Burkholderiales bacterium]|nr:NAD-dependent epimerase/dehydratase family protein [Burkholderiales bacterium]